MLPIYVMWDSGLEPFEVACIREALIEFQTLFPRRKIEIFGSSRWSYGDYSSCDWYIQHAKRITRPNGTVVQLDANSIVNLMLTEPWQKTNQHIDICFTSQDLTCGNLNFCFGLAFGRCTVQSVCRYRNLSPEDRKLSIKSVLWHELGHILGAARDLRRVNTEERLGPHCTCYGCVMRQGVNLLEWVRHAREMRDTRAIYCPSCLSDMRRSIL